MNPDAKRLCSREAPGGAASRWLQFVFWCRRASIRLAMGRPMGRFMGRPMGRPMGSPMGRLVHGALFPFIPLHLQTQGHPHPHLRARNGKFNIFVFWCLLGGNCCGDKDVVQVLLFLFEFDMDPAMTRLRCKSMLKTKSTMNIVRSSGLFIVRKRRSGTKRLAV